MFEGDGVYAEGRLFKKGGRMRRDVFEGGIFGKEVVLDGAMEGV